VLAFRKINCTSLVVFLAFMFLQLIASASASGAESQTATVSRAVSSLWNDGKGIETFDLSTAAGQKWEFRPDGGAWQSIKVPYGGWKTQGFTCNSGLYRSWIQVPTSARGQRVRISFAAVNFGATVMAGPDETHLRTVVEHLNGWMPFVADLTDISAPGAKVLVEVQVKGRGEYLLPNNKYSIAEGATWFSGLADGIIRGVALQIVPEVHVEDVAIRTARNPDTVTVSVKLSNGGVSPKAVKVNCEFNSWNKRFRGYPELRPILAMVPGHGTLQVDFPPTAWPLGPESYWWPNVPYKSDYVAQLHVASIGIELGKKVVETRDQRFGFREFKAVGNHYELNGVHINLRGDNQQEANFGTDAYGIKPGCWTVSSSKVDRIQR
jgi:hypothetical protein